MGKVPHLSADPLFRSYRGCIISSMTDGAGLDVGRSALSSGEWERALHAFDDVLSMSSDAEALDGSARALWWLGRIPEAIERRRDAYAVFRKGGDLGRAARIALWLANEHRVQGSDAVARGWFARAERICAGLPPSPAHGWLAIAKTERMDDPVEKARHATEALDIAHKHSDADLEIRALARSGLALVAQGLIEEGAARFDEAMAAATGGEAFELDVLGETYCDMFAAIGIAGDDGAFDEWTGVINAYLAQTSHAAGLAFCGSCCGELFTAAGQLDVAEKKMMKTLRELSESGQRARCVHPASKLAELRVVQGRFEDADRLLEGFETLPETVHARVSLALARGQNAVAAALLERRLTALGPDSMLSVPFLAQLVEVRISKADLDGARAAAERLRAFAESSRYPRAIAEADRAWGRVQISSGDRDAGRASLEWAIELFEKIRKPLEGARTRLLLAEALTASDPEIAATEARTAVATFTQVGATRDADLAASLLRALTGEGRSGPKGYGTLSKREQEVLALVAEGLTNAEIGARLFISTKTAGHHVSNILSKLGLRSRAEAAAWSLRVDAPA